MVFCTAANIPGRVNLEKEFCEIRVKVLTMEILLTSGSGTFFQFLKDTGLDHRIFSFLLFVFFLLCCSGLDNSGSYSNTVGGGNAP